MYHGHSRSDARKMRLHEVALAKLRDQPSRLASCIELLDQWLPDPGQQSVSEVLKQWKFILSNWSIEEIEALVLDEREGQVLRQCSPLGPLLTPRERWELLAEIDQTTTGEQEPA